MEENPNYNKPCASYSGQYISICHVDSEKEAHLIAAAPDMYEALLAIKERCVLNDIELPDDVVVQAARALAKAKGLPALT